jgi:hypothetical protein
MVDLLRRTTRLSRRYPLRRIGGNPRFVLPQLDFQEQEITRLNEEARLRNLSGPPNKSRPRLGCVSANCGTSSIFSRTLTSILSLAEPPERARIPIQASQVIPSSGYRIPCVVLKLEPNAMNWLTKNKTMMIGIDVTHLAGPSSRKGIPPIAAVVGNADDNFVQFPANLRIQQHNRKEVRLVRD